MLDAIWTDQTGQEIVYAWVDWLHDSSLSHLKFDNRIPLASFENIDNAGDRRAISESVCPSVDIPSIINYNADKCNEKFCQNLHGCCICLNESAGTKFVRLPCEHFFCRNCMETYSTIHAKEGVSILCPQIKCRELVPPALVKSLLGDAKFEQWESLLFSKTLDSMSDVVYCPRCGMACLQDGDHLAQCPKCFFTFCGLCRDRFHAGDPCMTPEKKFAKLKLKFLQMTELLSKEQCRELDMINQYLNEKEIMRTSQRCPNCLMSISRISGCDHMHCSRGYGTNNQMMREARLLHQEQQILLAEDPANHAHSCPICRQMNAKVGNNNHMFCWYCQTYYCYLCQKIVKRSSEHYGPKGCKQHSAG
ncbi:hypothetical protein MKW94_022127 [Papaver nudicaule]|uniref:RBR-type E3 ubiquitin transferase n=1 Tax=Papaver nudicaule TaxID=74823 RepID=A0AA41RR00_PAPNU|nr:hypothetical protein [Papaver nudicaule]